MIAEALRHDVCAANRELARRGLVALTWGNVSGIDRDQGWIAIKPSGVAYAALTPEQVVVLDLAGAVVDGSLRPSSDTPTHVALYRAFAAIGGVTHTHSRYATAFAQARREIPCLGTTHADLFHGAVPLTRVLTAHEVEADYEGNTGAVMRERFADLDPLAFPGVLVAGHAPFSWGRSALDSVDQAEALEAIAEMAWLSRLLNPDTPELEAHVLDKHFQRKHGPDAYYGQKQN